MPLTARAIPALLMLAVLGACTKKGEKAQPPPSASLQTTSEATPPKSRKYSLVVAGYGVEATPKLPVGVAHLADGTLIFGPISVAQAKGQAGTRVKNVLLKPGKAPAGTLEKRTQPGSPIATYSTGEPGTTMLALGTDMDGYGPVLETFEKAEHPAEWILLTKDHEVRWPSRFTLRADGESSPRSGPYELALDGSGENVLWLQGPLRGPEQIPAPERL